jgi:hypothetical protein
VPLPSVADLERLLATAESAIRRQLLTAFLRIRRGLPLNELERAIVTQNLNEALDTVGLEPALNALSQTQVLTDAVREAGWYDGLRGLPRAVLQRPMVELSLGANATANPDALEAIRRQNLTRITAITEETRSAIRQALTTGLQRGTPPRELARQLRDVVGLNTRQAAAVEAFRVRLTAQGRDPAQLERMVDRYSRRQLTVRTEAIARTETMAALAEGKRAQWDRLQREGVIQADEWETVFVTAEDERVCPICAPLDGQRDPIGRGPQPPLHPLCRCDRQLTLAGFRAGEKRNRFRRVAA